MPAEGLKSTKMFDGGNSISKTIDSGQDTIYSDDLPPFDPSKEKNQMTAAFEASGGSGTVVVTWEYFHDSGFSNNSGYGPGNTVATLTIGASSITEVDFYSDSSTRSWWGKLSKEKKGRFKFVRSNTTGTTTIRAVAHRE